MNETEPQVSQWNKFFFSVGFILIILFMGGMYLVNYDVALTMWWSTLISVVLLSLFLFLLKIMKAKLALFTMGGIIVTLFILSTFVLLFKINNPSNSQFIPDCKKEGEKTEIRFLRSYNTEIEFVDQSAGVFKANSFITYDREQYICESGRFVENKVIAEGVQKNLPEIEVNSTPVGYFLSEITISMDEWDVIKNMNFASKSASSVSIEDLPYQSFYDAAFIDHINSNEYMGKETISWDEDHAYSIIRFVYIRPPFHNLRPIITPLIEFSKYDNSLLAVIGFLIPFILFSIISPVIVGYFQNAVRNLFKKPATITTPKTKNVRKNNRN